MRFMSSKVNKRVSTFYWSLIRDQRFHQWLHEWIQDWKCSGLVFTSSVLLWISVEANSWINVARTSSGLGNDANAQKIVIQYFSVHFYLLLHYCSFNYVLLHFKASFYYISSYCGVPLPFGHVSIVNRNISTKSQQKGTTGAPISTNSSAALEERLQEEPDAVGSQLQLLTVQTSREKSRGHWGHLSGSESLRSPGTTLSSPNIHACVCVCVRVGVCVCPFNWPFVPNSGCIDMPFICKASLWFLL